MYTTSYAMRSIYRYRTRYLLFAFALVFLFGVCFVNLTLGTSANAVCEALKKEYGTKMVVKATNASNYYLDLSQYEYFNSQELVEEMELHSAVYKWDNQSAVSDENPKGLPLSYLWLIGQNSAYINQFNRRQNPAVLLEGRLYEKEDECVITDYFYYRLQEANILHQVGDTLTLKQTKINFVNGKIEPEYSYTAYTVVGVVDAATLDPRYGNNGPKEKEAMFFPIETVQQLLENSQMHLLYYDSQYYNPKTEICTGYEIVYRLHDYRDAEKFTQFVSEENYALYTSYIKNHDFLMADDAQLGFVAEPLIPEFGQFLAPLEQLQTFTTLTTVTVAVLALAVVLLMCIINMRERKYEIGVLRCVGMSRPRINLSLGFESAVFLLCAALVGIALGLGVSALSGGLFLDLTVVETAIDTAAISRRVAAALVASALVLSLFATTVSAAFVMRARPLAILRNRT